MAKKPPNIGELQPGSAAWMKAYDALSPEDQASIFNATYNDPTQDEFQDFESFDNGAGFGAPPLAGTASYSPVVAMSGAELDPFTQQLLQFGGGVNIPQYTSAGKLDPYDLGQEAARTTLGRSQITSLADIIGSALAGPGAIDPSLFQPEITMPTERLKLTGLSENERYAKGTGWQSYIANAVRPKELGGRGLTDAEATADMWKFLNDTSGVDKPGGKVTQQMLDVRDSILSDLPANLQAVQNAGTATDLEIARQKMTPMQQMQSQYDQIGIQKFAADQFGKVNADVEAQGAGWQDPNDPSKWYTSAPTQEPSYMTTYFHNRGLPTPNEQYTDPERMNQMISAQAGPDWQQQIAQTFTGAAQRQADIDELARKSNQASDYNMQLQALLNEPRNQPTPGGLRARTPGELGQAMNSVTQFMAPGAAQAGAPYTISSPTRHAEIVPTAQDAARNIGRAQVSAALTNLASQPNQPARPAINQIYSFQDALGQPLGATTDPRTARAAQRQAAVQSGDLFGAFWGGGKAPKKIGPNAGKQAQQASDAARRAYENAYASNWQQNNWTTSPARGAQIDALYNANYAQQQGRTPFVDAMIQRLLGQRARGLRGI